MLHLLSKPVIVFPTSNGLSDVSTKSCNFDSFFAS
jgi:hypothetical protein